MLLKDDELLDRIENDWRTAGLSERRNAMLGFVEKLTETPGQMAEDDVERLRAAGLSDRDILDIVEVASYYAYVNRVADGLGVAVEDWFDDGP